ncbi:hypothetical protein [Ferrimonas pelagia]|uniref:Uncharacterized protein n=1 Tax=Ferrimonas pelagia TaxID=1177826 RepID=A0ABP9EXK9_9GAMM
MNSYVNGAEDVGFFIAKQVPKRVLIAPEPDGKTVLEWAQGNGHAESVIASEISYRAHDE